MSEQVLIALISLTVGAIVGGFSSYLVQRMLERSKVGDSKRAYSDELKKLEAMMPDLFQVLRSDLRSNPIRRYYILEDPDHPDGTPKGPPPPKLAGHSFALVSAEIVPEVFNKMDILAFREIVSKQMVTNKIPLYMLTEQFADWLIETTPKK